MSICILCPEGHSVSIVPTKLGSVVVCPQCLASFLAEIPHDLAKHARPEKGKPQRSRDEDEDDEDDEKPRKKAKPAKPAGKAKKTAAKDEDEEDEKPRKKAKASKGKDDDEDEEDGEEESGEPQDEEEPIDWTPRKRQLNICSHGLMVMIVACYMLVAFAVFTMISVDYYEILEDFTKEEWRGGPAYYIFYYAAVPMLYLTTAALMVSMGISFAVPAKAEARAGIVSTQVFGGLVFLFAILLILTKTGAIVTDDIREANMSQLLAGASMLCFAVCFLSAMGYMSRLLVFMKLHMESSQPITNGAFALLSFAVILILVMVLSTMAKRNMGGWVAYVIALLVDACVGFSIYILVSHTGLIQKLRKSIRTYIKDG